VTTGNHVEFRRASLTSWHFKSRPNTKGIIFSVLAMLIPVGNYWRYKRFKAEILKTSMVPYVKKGQKATAGKKRLAFVSDDCTVLFPVHQPASLINQTLCGFCQWRLYGALFPTKHWLPAKRCSISCLLA
jgi:hypothetical protein